MTETINATYGSGNTPCLVFIYEDNDGLFWYAVEDSAGVNCTHDKPEDGCDVELINDIDFFTWSDAITSEEELVKAVNF